MAELKQDGLIGPRHQTLLQLTPFHYILQLPHLELNHSLLQELLVQYDNFDSSFTIAGHRLKFKSDDVALIFGLPNHGKPVKLKAIKNKDFFHRVFEKGAVSRFEIVYQLRRHGMDQSDHSVEAFVVLLLGLFISTVLAPSSNASIPASLWSYVDQLDHICDYDWGQLVYRELIDEIGRAKCHIAGEDADDEPSDSTYGGCFLALQLWICEIAGLGKNKKEDCSPRILGWGRNSMYGILEQFRNLQPSDIRPPLSPRDSERHLLDNTILPSDPQPGLPSSTTFQPSNLKNSVMLI
ncbi:hypothetical protein KSP39_PZI016398 [Platanthera zijinensis]|uniref:Aminotransferase-like plant mobile domain-containing protein n=1 Tax=Platanthera zijinensis TaxID=2320716 RepID=A0AAP0G0E4_9ASPA